MATLYRCVHGHLWEDLMGAPSLVDGQIRCPNCGRSSEPYSSDDSPQNTSSLLAPAVKDSSTPLPQATRVLPTAPPVLPRAVDQTPTPSPAMATVINPALINLSVRTDPLVADDIEINATPGVPDATSEIKVVPFAPIDPDLTHSAPECDPPVQPAFRERSTLRESARARATSPAGKTLPNIPNYELLGELGRGGMGVVYKARQKGLNRIVALKMILAGSAADDRDRARFKTEAEAIARLQHPNIVQIFEVGEHATGDWFSLEFVDGGSLADRLKGQAIPVHESARLIETLARAVNFAHVHGVIHRDLKPANVLLQKEGQTDSQVELASKDRLPKSVTSSASAVAAVTQLTPKITDFGLAKTMDEQDIHHTRSGMVVGTPGYMAPEQATGSNTIGPATDTYALGVILFQLVTGKLPFVGESPMEVMLKVTQEEPPRPRKLQPKLAADLETIILKCLEKDPKRRYATAYDLAEDLRRFLAHEPILARPVQPWERVVRWVKKHPAVAGMVGVVVLALAGVLATVGVLARNEQLRVAREREEVTAALDRARQEADRSNPTYATWKNVRGLLEEPGKRVRKDPGLADLAQPIDELLAKADGYVNAEDTYTSFQKARDEALFQAALALGTASQVHVEATIGKVEEALAVVGASRTKPPAADAFYTGEQGKEIQRGCYELLLVLADAISQRLTNQPDEQVRANSTEALAILQTAGEIAKTLGSTHAYHLRRARLLAVVGDREEANKESDRAKATEPKDDLDLYLVGSDRFRARDLAGAAKAFEQSLAKRPGNFWARLYLALCQIGLREWTAARDNLTACLGQKQQVRIYLLRGFVRGQLGDLQAALEDYNTAEALLKNNPDLEMQYGLYNNRAVTRIGLGQEHFAEAEADLKRAIELAPQEFQAYVALSQVYRVQKDVKRAVATLDEGLKHAMDLHARQALDVDTLFRLRRLRYAMHTETKDSKAALADLELLIGLTGVNPEAQGRAVRDQGHILFREHKFEQALVAYDKAKKLLPNQIELERWRGESLMRVSPPQFEQAIAAYSRYIEENGRPELSVFRGRALAYQQVGKHEEAIADLVRALGMKTAKGTKVAKPDQEADLNLLLGHAYFGCSAWALAEKAFTAAFTTREASAATRLAAIQGRALVRLRDRQFDNAAKDAEEIVRNAKGAPLALYGAACILAQVAGQIEPPRDGVKRGGQDERRMYQGRAVGLLQQALEGMKKEERSKFWRETVVKESALQPLYSHESYVTLNRRYSLN